ncbi:MAG: HAD family hydrolase [Phormidesmis sp.]
MATIRCRGQVFESIQAVLFDKDGTLANVESYLRNLGFERSRLIARQVSPMQAPALESAILAAFGLSTQRLDPAGLLAVGSRHDNEIAAAACMAAIGWGWVAAVESAKSAFAEAETLLGLKVSQTPLLPNVLLLLRALSRANILIGVVSSDLHSEVAAFLDYYQLPDIAWYCGASTTAPPKTHATFLKIACAALSVPCAQTLIIGDSAADLGLANQGAAGFLGMTGGWQDPPVISATAITFSNLAQVEAFK